MNLIVVDDEPLIAHTLADILSGEGHRTIAVLNGESAVKAAEAIRPDAVIMDVIMPGMDGIETAKNILHSVPGCRIILFSGQASSSDMLEKAREQGYEFEVLAKPINPTILLSTLTGQTITETRRLA
jgi:CheY-like chemotaxis protein